jgi:hypothetical protein
VRHDHDDDRLTIGCIACIERVRTDQIVDQFVEWFQTCEWDDAPLPDRSPHGLRAVKVYRALRGLGYERHDVRAVIALWQVEWLDRLGQPTTDPARTLL